VIAGKRRGVRSRGDFCARGARRLHTGKRMIALNGRGIAWTGFRALSCRRDAGRCAAGATDMMALRLDRGNRRTRMRGDNAGTVQLRSKYDQSIESPQSSTASGVTVQRNVTAQQGRRNIAI
jgi:hypothetical protein